MKLHTSFAGRRAWRHIRAKAQAGEQREQLSIFRATQFHTWKPSHETLASKRLPHDGCAVCGPLVGSIRKHQIDDIKNMHAFAGDFKHRCGWFIDVLPLFQANTQNLCEMSWGMRPGPLSKLAGLIIIRSCERYSASDVDLHHVVYVLKEHETTKAWVQTECKQQTDFKQVQMMAATYTNLSPLYSRVVGLRIVTRCHNTDIINDYVHLIPVLSFGEIQRKVWTALSPRDGNFLEGVLRDATSSLARVLMDLQHAAKTFWEQSFQGSSCFKYVQVITNDPRRGQFH